MKWYHILNLIGLSWYWHCTALVCLLFVPGCQSGWTFLILTPRSSLVLVCYSWIFFCGRFSHIFCSILFHCCFFWLLFKGSLLCYGEKVFDRIYTSSISSQVVVCLLLYWNILTNWNFNTHEFQFINVSSSGIIYLFFWWTFLIYLCVVLRIVSRQVFHHCVPTPVPGIVFMIKEMMAY